MDTILIAVTALSLAAAAGMGAMLFRTLRLERRRSDARVELLEQMAGTRLAPVSDDLELRPGPRQASTKPSVATEMFEKPETPPAWPRRLAVAGVLAAIVFALFVGRRGVGSSEPSGVQAPRQVTTAAATQPLELLSLQHAQQDGTLLISGLVQNPRDGAPIANVQATAVLFGTDGSTLTSVRAPIDFATLSPGDESPFVIRIPAAAAVSRYRVGFRAGDDTVLNHVDRRDTEAVARKEAP